MNGYEKMIRLRRMKITKIISAFTALSMTVTGLAVAASANSASPDFISEALGELSNYGIVAGDMVTSSHFESNFAVQNLKLNNNYDVSSFVSGKNRTVSCSVTAEGDFGEGEGEVFYLGVYCNGDLIDIDYVDYVSSINDTDDSADSVSEDAGELNRGIIAIKFDKPGTRTFTFTIPSEYKYKTIYIHKLACVANDDGKGQLVQIDEGTALYPYADSENDLLALNGNTIIADSLDVHTEMFGSNKTVYVGPEVYRYIDFKPEPDGRVSYNRVPLYEWKQSEESNYWEKIPVLDADGNQTYSGDVIIANNTNKFKLLPTAHDDVQTLLDSMQTASNALASVNSESANEKVLYYEVHGSVTSDTPDSYAILDKYKFVMDHPDYSLLVNVYLDKGENTFRFNSRDVLDNDVDTSSRIVFNFIGGNVKDTHITLSDGFRGTALAPNARVSLGSTICGAVYAPQFAVSNGELHMATYRAFNHSYEAYFSPPPEETTPETTLISTPPTETTPETTSVSTPPEETTPETTPVSTPPTETTPETTPESTPPEETTLETTPVSTPPMETTPETTPESKPPEETTPETTSVSTPPMETIPETTPPEDITTTAATSPVTTSSAGTTTIPSESIPETTTTDDRPHFFIPTTTTTTVPETTPADMSTPPADTTTLPPEVTTSADPVDPFEFDNTETTTTVGIYSEENRPVPPPHVIETVATTTVPIIFELDEDVPRGMIPPNLPLIEIDDEVPLSDRPMNTGVDSKVGLFAAIGGAALLIGVGAQIYSAILKKKS